MIFAYEMQPALPSLPGFFPSLQLKIRACTEIVKPKTRADQDAQTALPFLFLFLCSRRKTSL